MTFEWPKPDELKYLENPRGAIVEALKKSAVDERDFARLEAHLEVVEENAARDAEIKLAARIMTALGDLVNYEEVADPNMRELS